MVTGENGCAVGSRDARRCVVQEGSGAEHVRCGAVGRDWREGEVVRAQGGEAVPSVRLALDVDSSRLKVVRGEGRGRRSRRRGGGG
jgi:hypothetical protein